MEGHAYDIVITGDGAMAARSGEEVASVSMGGGTICARIADGQAYVSTGGSAINVRNAGATSSIMHLSTRAAWGGNAVRARSAEDVTSVGIGCGAAVAWSAEGAASASICLCELKEGGACAHSANPAIL